MASRYKKIRLEVDSGRGRQRIEDRIFLEEKFQEDNVNMGQNYAKYCRMSGMLNNPVETFELTRNHREAIHGPSDFILMVKGRLFQ